MDIRKVKKLIDLLQESGIAEIEIKEGEESVRISRQSAVMVPSPGKLSWNWCISSIVHCGPTALTR